MYCRGIVSRLGTLVLIPRVSSSPAFPGGVWLGVCCWLVLAGCGAKTVATPGVGAGFGGSSAGTSGRAGVLGGGGIAGKGGGGGPGIAGQSGTVGQGGVGGQGGAGGQGGVLGQAGVGGRAGASGGFGMCSQGYDCRFSNAQQVCLPQGSTEPAACTSPNAPCNSPPGGICRYWGGFNTRCIVRCRAGGFGGQGGSGGQGGVSGAGGPGPCPALWVCTTRPALAGIRYCSYSEGASPPLCNMPNCWRLNGVCRYSGLCIRECR